MTLPASKVDVQGRVDARGAEVLTDDALGFLAGLHREFDARRLALLARRVARQARLDSGGTLDFLSDTREVREGDWQVAPAPTTCSAAASRSPARRRRR